MKNGQKKSANVRAIKHNQSSFHKKIKQMKHLFLIVAFASSYCFAQAPAIQWSQVIGGNFSDRYESVIQTSDGGFLCVGETNSSTGTISNLGGNNYDGVVVKYSSTGIIEWNFAYGNTNSNSFEDVKQTPDGGYILAGSREGVIGFDPNCTFCSSQEYWMVKLTSTGTIEWEQSYGSAAHDELRTVALTNDGGYVFAGYSSGFSGNVSVAPDGENSIWVVKTNNLGVLQWERSVGGVDFDDAHAIRQTADGGFILVGTSENSTFNSATTDIRVVKLTSNGLVEWQQVYGNTGVNETGGDILETTDGGFLVLGTASAPSEILSASFGNTDAVLFKINASGTVVWAQHYGGTNSDSGISISATSDGNYLIAGGTNSNNGQFTGNSGSTDAWVAKITPTGTLLWSKLVGGNLVDFITTMTSSSDGGCVFVGGTNSTSGTLSPTVGLYDAYIVKLEGTPAGPPDSDSTFTVSACGISYPFQGELYLTSGTYFDTIPNALGGDSLLTLHLTLNPIYSNTLNESACGSYYFDNQFIEESGVYTAFYQSISGCDSVVNLNLTILPDLLGTDIISSCDPIQWRDGNWYETSTQTPTFIVENSSGCDSLITLHFTRLENPSIDVVQLNDSTLQVPNAASYQWFDCATNNPISGENAATFVASTSGEYGVTVTSASGCSRTSDCYPLIVLSTSELDQEAIRLYPNPTLETIQIEGWNETMSNETIRIFDLQGKMIVATEFKTSISVNQLERGTYLLQVGNGLLLHPFVKL